LRDLIHEVRSAATDAGVTITTEPADRRALVTALRWMIDQGLAHEVHERVERYLADEAADAVLRVRPDRVALLPLPALAASGDVDELLDRSEQRRATRAWLRSQLLEEPVVYRSDLDEVEWSELRRRQGEDDAIFAEMFDVHIEARAEGLAIVDEQGDLTDSPFPRGGTVGHAALLLLDRVTDGAAPSPVLSRASVDAIVAELAADHRKYWSQLAVDPLRLGDAVLALLQDHRLVTVDNDTVTLMPAAWRYAVDVTAEEAEPAQGTLL
jgi:uncharacterized protein (TIGR02678 family)